MPEMFEVSGLAETMAMLREAPQTIKAKGYIKALSAGGNIIASAIEGLCPVKAEDTGGLLDRGELREGVSVEVTLDTQLRGGIAKIGWTTKRLADVANWVEFGHRVVIPNGGTYRDGKGRTRKGSHVADVPAHPFIRPGFDASAEAAVDAMAASLSQTVAEEFPTATGKAA
jgi:hypothetical protein